MTPQLARDIVALVDEFSPIARQGVESSADTSRRPLPASSLLALSPMGSSSAESGGAPSRPAHSLHTPALGG